MSKNAVREGQWIYVGKSRIPAYVISVISDEEVSAGYYAKAIQENFVLVDGRWSTSQECRAPSRIW